jgi:arginyl-tRNA synthetase
MQLAGRLRRKPRDVADALTSNLASQADLADLLDRVEVAGPGFINFWLHEAAVTDVLSDVIAAGAGYGVSAPRSALRINVEFVSANPTGPLHVGHGRGAALGDAIAALLEAAGHTVTREFYVNDAGLQIEKLAKSLWARVQQAVGRDAEIPEGGYHGDYLRELADDILRSMGDEFADQPAEEALVTCREIAVSHERERQVQDLKEFGVTFDVFYNESTLYQDGEIEATLSELADKRLTYDEEGALWLRTSQFGDGKDRVLRKSDGTFTYFLPDIAYHRTKAARGYQRAIDVWGADHHGYVARMASALRSLGLPDDFFHAELVQLVKIVRGGEELRFSKRSGEFVTLRDLYEETGVDAARYFFLMRRSDQQFVFDIDLATKQSEENPVYYVQYAHTRMAGIFRNAEVEPKEIAVEAAEAAGAAGEGGPAAAAVLVAGKPADLTLLTEPAEQDLLKRLAEFPDVVARAVDALEPHRVVNYLDEVSQLVNAWYHHHRVLGVGEELERARLVLARAAQLVLANALALLGVSAPQRM